jgi:hypothetical protein
MQVSKLQVEWTESVLEVEIVKCNYKCLIENGPVEPILFVYTSRVLFDGRVLY